MAELTAARRAGQDLVERIEKASGADISNCYQCGKCTAGCPLSPAMDFGPRQIMRLLQLGLVDEALHAHSPWLCLACVTCSLRCPRGVPVAAVMEVLRIMAKERGIVPERNIDVFGDLFLSSVEGIGRLSEFGLSLGFNLGSFQLLKDVGVAPALFLSGKARLRSTRVSDRQAIKDIFARSRERGGLIE